MKDLYNGFILHQRPKRTKVKPFCQWVDCNSCLAITNLHQTKLRIIGAFTYKFCVNRKKWGVSKLVCDFAQGPGVGDGFNTIWFGAPLRRRVDVKFH